MKTLQTILGSLALAGAVTVPASGQISKVDSLDSALIDNNSSKNKIELLQDKEKTVAEQIFDVYKGKIFKCKTVLIAGETERSEVDSIYEFPQEMSGLVKCYFGGKGVSSKGRLSLGMKANKDNDVLMIDESFTLSGEDFADEDFWLHISRDSESNKHVLELLSRNSKKNKWYNYDGALSMSLTEISKKEYESIEKLRKGVVGKYKATAMYHEIGDDKIRMDLPGSDFGDSVRRLTFSAVDPETDKPFKYTAEVQSRIHYPLEIELTDSGEMIFNKSKSEQPFKTVYDLDLCTYMFNFHSFTEIRKISPKDHAENTIEYFNREFLNELEPILQNDGTFSLNFRLPPSEGGEKIFYVLEKVK